VIQPEEIPKDTTTDIPRVLPSHPAIVEWRAMTVVLLCVSLSLIFLLSLHCIRRPPFTRFKRCAYARHDTMCTQSVLPAVSCAFPYCIASQRRALPSLSFLLPFHPLPSLHFSLPLSFFLYFSSLTYPLHPQRPHPPRPPHCPPRSHPHPHANAPERHLDRGQDDRGAAASRERWEGGGRAAD
jgi:hypothetical protein